jgi:hypothetical protein
MDFNKQRSDDARDHGTDSSLLKVIRRLDPGVFMTEPTERIGETLDVACAIIKEVKAHVLLRHSMDRFGDYEKCRSKLSFDKKLYAI